MYANLGMAVEGGANTRPGKAAGKGENAGVGATLEDGYAGGTAMDWFA